MEKSLFIGLVQNIAILLSFSLLYEFVWWNERKYTKVYYRIILGVIIGAIGMLLMITPWMGIPGISFDTRTILLLNAGLFFGPVSTIVAMVILVAFRIYMWGGGIMMGILTIITSGFIGMLWRWKFPDWRRGNYGKNLYCVSLLVHVVMMLCTLSLPKEQIIPTVKAIILPVLLIYPLASLVLGKVLMRRLNAWKAHEAIALGEERYKRFINANRDCMFIKDDQFRYIILNDSMCTVFGRPMEDIVNKTDYDFLDRQYADICRESDMNTLNKGVMVQLEETIKGKIYEVRKFPINIGRGKTGIGGILRDITGTFKSRELQKALLDISQLSYENTTLREYFYNVHKQLSRVIKSDNIYIALYHPEDNSYSFPYYIDEYEEFESDESVNMERSLTEYIRIKGKGALIRAEDEERIKKEYPLEYQGKYSPIWMGAPLIGGARETVIGVIAVQDYHDENAYSEEDLLTLEIFANRVGVYIERATNLKELKEAKERAEKNDRLKTAFLANISHEIRTPMNGIIGFTDILIGELEKPEHKEYVSIINSSAYRLLSTVNDVIDIAKIEAGEVLLHMERFNIYEVLRHLYTVFNRSTLKVELKISTPLYQTERILEDDGALSLMIMTDRTKFVQIYTNLISNAIKFTSQGLVEFGFYKEKENKEKENGRMVFYVRDTGKGIKSDEIDFIFQRFYQIEDDKTGYHEGTGLGLTIVKEYVTLMGGEVWVKSEPGAGSTFFFTLYKT